MNRVCRFIDEHYRAIMIGFMAFEGIALLFLCVLDSIMLYHVLTHDAVKKVAPIEHCIVEIDSGEEDNTCGFFPHDKIVNGKCIPSVEDRK